MNHQVNFVRHWVPLWLLVALAYIGLGKICLALGTIGGTASPFWLPAGLVMALSLKMGYRVLPGIFLGEFLLGYFFMPGPIWKHLMISTGNVLEGAAVILLAPRLMHGNDVLGSVRNFFGFFAASAVGSAFNATLGVASLWLSGLIPLAAFGNVAMNWSIGDLGGTLIVAPLLLSWHKPDIRDWQGMRLIEFLILLASACGLADAIFGNFLILDSSPLAFLLLPFMLWASFRFGPANCTLLNALIIGIAIWGTTHGRGPFVADSPTDSLILIQLFTSVLITTSILALIVNRDLFRTMETLSNQAAVLEIKVAQRTSQLEDAKMAAESASRAKSEFLASMSHELRTPLNAILGFAQLFKMDRQISQETQEHADEIIRAGQHLLSLVNDLIDLARIESGKMELSVEATSVKSVIAESIAMTSPLARARNIALTVDADVHETMTVHADNGRLRQALINFLSNAIKYNHPHGKVTLTVVANDGRVRFNVSDTGYGIPAEKQQRVFNETFDRLGKEGGTVEGAGIGLVITKRIVEAMGGTIGFESTEGKGSTFWVEFPMDVPADIAASPAKPVPEDTTPAPDTMSDKPRLLLAEDNTINQRLAVAVLTRLGYPVDVVENGVKAVEAARTGQYALILMDCQMPEMDGYEATTAIRQAEADTDLHVPIVAMTANAMHGDREKCIAIGMDDYMPKPMNLERLQEVLDTWLPK